jgi:hypothetical protein
MIGIGIGLPFIKSAGETSTPASISDLKVWLKGDSGITLVGGEVDVWADQSGNGINLSAAAAINRPTIATRNNKNVLVFNGSTKWLRNIGAGIAANVSGLTIIVAGASNSATFSRQSQVTIGSGTGGVRAGIGWGWLDPARLGRDAGGRRLNGDSFVGCGQLAYNADWSNNSARFNYSSAILQTYNNNVATDSLNPFQTAGNTPNDGGDLYVGVGLVGVGRLLNGPIGEILIYHKTLTDSELIQVQTYLAARWA